VTEADEARQVASGIEIVRFEGVEREIEGDVFMIASDDHGISLSIQAQVKKRPPLISSLGVFPVASIAFTHSGALAALRQPGAHRDLIAVTHLKMIADFQTADYPANGVLVVPLKGISGIARRLNSSLLHVFYTYRCSDVRRNPTRRGAHESSRQRHGLLR
jgi:hypothetical protein